MSNFKIEVGGHCSNGALVLEVYMGESEGVVLCDWRDEFVTWSFLRSEQNVTVHGHYFRYEAGTDEEAEVYEQASEDFLNRVIRAHKLN